jgi:Protein of unknown function (DUF998)
VHAALHDLFSLLTFAGLPIACLVLARRFAGWSQRGWAIYSAVTGAVFLVGFVLTSMAFNQVESLVAFGGLVQRLTITVGWTWLTLLAVTCCEPCPNAPNRRGPRRCPGLGSGGGRRGWPPRRTRWRRGRRSRPGRC